MDEAEKEGIIEREAQLYIKLGELLKEPRDEESARRIEALIQQPLPLAEKIAEIESIDQENAPCDPAVRRRPPVFREAPVRHTAATREEPAAAHPRARLPSSSGSAERRERGAVARGGETRDEEGRPSGQPPTTPRTASLLAAAKARSSLSLEAPRSSLFAYIFVEAPKMRAFGKTSHVFRNGFLPFSVHLDPEIGRSFAAVVQGAMAKVLIPEADAVLAEGWMRLSKKDYNLVAAFRRLLSRVVEFNFRPEDPSAPSFLRALRALESEFFLFHLVPGAVDELGVALSVALSVAPEAGQPGDERRPRAKTIAIAQRLLSREAMLPSLFNVLIGFRMLAARRYLSFQQLAHREPGRLLSVDDFDCSDEVRARIDEHVEARLRDLARVGAELAEADRVRSYLPAAAGGDPDYSRLERLYCFRADSRAWAKDKDNAVALAARLAERYGAAFRSLLCGTIALRGGGTASLFGDKAFEADFERIERQGARLAKMLPGFQSFPFPRYAALRSTAARGTQFEVEAVGAITEATGTMARLGRAMSDMLRARGGAAGAASRTFPIPHEADEIESQGFAGGMKVAEALETFAAVSFLAGAYFQDPAVAGLEDKAELLRRELAAGLECLDRIADREQLAKVSGAYRLLAAGVSAAPVP